jgi:hypothetical protein
MSKLKKKQKANPIRHYASSEVQVVESCSFSVGNGDSEFALSARTGQELLAILEFSERYSLIKKLLNGNP